MKDPLPKEKLMFNPFDAFLAVWQTILIIAVHHPWLPIVFLMVFLGLDMLIDRLYEKNHPHE